MGSGKHISRAIKKYGTESFKRETLFAYWYIEQAYAKEAEIVTEEFIKHDWNYNLTPGGCIPLSMLGWVPSEETRKKISINKKGKRPHSYTAETRKKQSEWRTGKSFCVYYTDGLNNVYQLETLSPPVGYWRGYTTPKLTCPQCNKIGPARNMKRWHFDNCRELINVQ